MLQVLQPSLSVLTAEATLWCYKGVELKKFEQPKVFLGFWILVPSVRGGIFGYTMGAATSSKNVSRAIKYRNTWMKECRHRVIQQTYCCDPWPAISTNVESVQTANTYLKGRFSGIADPKMQRRSHFGSFSKSCGILAWLPVDSCRFSGVSPKRTTLISKSCVHN